MYILPFLGLRASILRGKVQNLFLEPVPKDLLKQNPERRLQGPPSSSTITLI